MLKVKDVIDLKELEKYGFKLNKNKEPSLDLVSCRFFNSSSRLILDMKI